MSKTLEALKRVSDIRKNNSDVIAPKDQGLSVHPSAITSPDIGIKDFSRVPSDFSAAYQIQDNHRHESRFQNITLAFLACVGVVSLLLSFKTFAEIKKANSVSTTVIKDISVQKSKMATLEKTLAQIQDDSESKEKNLKDKLNKMVLLMNQNEGKIDDLTRENKQLRSSLGDLKWSVQSLTDKYIGINAQLNNITPKQ